MMNYPDGTDPNARTLGGPRGSRCHHGSGSYIGDTGERENGIVIVECSRCGQQWLDCEAEGLRGYDGKVDMEVTL